MSFISTLETIGKDILKGIEIATPIVGTFVPAAGPILTELALIITQLENSGKTLTADQLTQLIQSVATVSAVKQSTTPVPVAAPTS